MSNLTQFVARQAPIHQLSIKAAFDKLHPDEQKYAHYMSRASWHGTRIILRQTSPEAIDIFEWILNLYERCGGRWEELQQSTNLSEESLQAFLTYSACFLSNIGNYYGSGDQKFVPDLPLEVIEKLCQDQDLIKSMTAIPPYSLGFPSNNAQSAYYPGPELLSKQEIEQISKVLEVHGIHPENTRIQKRSTGSGEAEYRVLLSSVDHDGLSTNEFDANGLKVVLEPGDHQNELEKICHELKQAIGFAANETQSRILQLYIQSFKTGDLNFYREALRLWVKDTGPKIEHIVGFVEPYRDPFGIRAEFEALVAIADSEETKILQRLVRESDGFIKNLPWCDGQSSNGGKGPFEKSLFEPPDFSSIHVLAYCSSIIFPGINLPNYNDIREDCGFKNVIIANRMSAESSNLLPNPFVHRDDIDRFQKSKFPAYYIWVVLHELLGHGTGKMMCQYSDQSYNFDHKSPPLNPLSGQPIQSWYRPGQTWTGQFRDLATTLDECRAELVGAYLMDDKKLLSIFGYTNDSEVTVDDLIYNLYMQLATDGLRGLTNYNVDSQSWGQAHSRAHFATLKCLLRNGQGCIKIDFDEAEGRLLVRVDERKIIPHGKAALRDMLLRLHMYRCTADVEACRSYYEDLSQVDGEYLKWRQIVLVRQPPKWIFVQPNTFLDGDNNVILKEYPATPEGVIQSWAERKV